MGMKAMPIATVTLVLPWPTIVTITSANSRPGKASSTSITRMISPAGQART